MSSLYPIPADNAKLMFHIYSAVLYLPMGTVCGAAFETIGWPGLVVGAVGGVLLSRKLRKTEEKVLVRSRTSRHPNR